MKRMFSKIEELAGHLKEYINTQIDLAKLTAAEKISSVLAGIIAGAIAAMVFIFVLVFGSLATAYALSAWIGTGYAGFLIVAGFYLLLGIVVWLARERLIRVPIMKNIIRELFKDKHVDQKK